MTSILDLLQTVAGNVWLYGISFALVLSVLVFIHEWGHYIVARMCGVHVEQFSIGFGKEIFGRTDKNGTRWKFSLVPLGGYVKMFGDTDPASAGQTDSVERADGQVTQMTEAERKVAFFSQPVWARSLIVFAGPAINFLFAILVLAGLYAYVGKPITPPVITAIQKESPADIAGLKPQDRVLSIEGQPLQSFRDLQRIVTIALDTPLNFVIDREGQVIEKTIVPNRLPVEDRFGFRHDKGQIGVLGPGEGISLSGIEQINGRPVSEDEDVVRQNVLNLMGKEFTILLNGYEDGQDFRVAPVLDKNAGLLDPESPLYNGLFLGAGEAQAIKEMGVLESVHEGVSQTWMITSDSLKAIWQILSGTRSAKELGGIIRIGAIAGDMAQQGTIALITFMALLSINLGLINLFPIPMLDGGHLVFYAIEAVKGKPLSEKAQDYAFKFGLVVLVSLMAFTNINDIVQIIF